MSLFDDESFLENIRNRQYHYFGNIVDIVGFNLYNYINSFAFIFLNL